SRYAAQRSALGGGAGEAGGEAPGLCAAGGQEHAEPTGVVAGRAADALSQDWARAGGDRTVVRGPVLGGAWTSAAADRAGSGCDGCSVARGSGRAVLPRLLRRVLLFAAVYLLRPALACGEAAPLEHCRICMRAGGTRKSGGADAFAMADRADQSEGGLGD